MKGEKLLIFYKRGSDAERTKIIRRDEFGSLGIKCPQSGCQGIVFPDRNVRKKCRETTKFGTCACCDTIITIPRESGKVPQCSRKTRLTKSLRNNVDAYLEKAFSM